MKNKHPLSSSEVQRRIQFDHLLMQSRLLRHKYYRNEYKHDEFQAGYNKRLSIASRQLAWYHLHCIITLRGQLK